jgi:hypothetical protein
MLDDSFPKQGRNEIYVLLRPCFNLYLFFMVLTSIFTLFLLEIDL